MGNIEALKSLYKYSQLLELSMTHFEDFSYFEGQSEIKVHVDYQRVTTNTISGYL